jgi:hypothetical protein
MYWCLWGGKIIPAEPPGYQLRSKKKGDQDLIFFESESFLTDRFPRFGPDNPGSSLSGHRPGFHSTLKGSASSLPEKQLKNEADLSQ